jgi:hypothetical protein
MLVLSTNTNPGTASWAPLPSSGMSYVELNPNADTLTASTINEQAFANTVTIPADTFTSALGYFDWICRFLVTNSDAVPVDFQVGLQIGASFTASLTKSAFTIQAGDTVAVNFPPIRVMQLGSQWDGMGILSLSNLNFGAPIATQVQQIAPIATGIDYTQALILTPSVQFGSVSSVSITCRQAQVVAVQP